MAIFTKYTRDNLTKALNKLETTKPKGKYVMKTQTDKTAVTDAGTPPRVTVKFESPSGKSLQSRFNALARYYANSDAPEQWIADEFKKSLIRNIERGVIVVARDGHNLGFA